MNRYLYGWFMFVRAFRMARAKKHGAGQQSLVNAFKMGAAYRFIVDGQHKRPVRPPFYLKDFA